MLQSRGTEKFAQVKPGPYVELQSTHIIADGADALYGGAGCCLGMTAAEDTVSSRPNDSKELPIMRLAIVGQVWIARCTQDEEGLGENNTDRR